MQRRLFLKQLAALGLAGAFPLSAIANGSTRVVNVREAFNLALSQRPELLGLASIEGNFPKQALQIEGRIPKALRGVFFRNGPAKHERADVRYKHWFEGDGMLQRFEFTDNAIHHEGKFINTPKFVEEEKAGHFLYSGPDTEIADSRSVSNSNHINTANTNVIPVNGELWALWEAGAATAVDPKSLDFKRQVNLGEGNQYESQLDGMPFSAHPKIDPTGDIWNVGLGPQGAIILYHLAPSGQLKNLGMVQSHYHGDMLHDFLITDKHIVLTLPSLERRYGEHGYFSNIHFNQQLAMRVMVIDKQSLTVKRQYELPAGFAFHFGNAWEDKAGNIKFDVSLYDNVDVLHEFNDIMAGKVAQKPTNAHTAIVSLYTSGKVDTTHFEDTSEFPRVCSHRTGLRHERLFYVSGDANDLWAHRIVARNINTGHVDQFDYGEAFIVEEHIPVCPSTEEEAGYLIGTALHVPFKRSCINIFDMQNVSNGPLARAWLPYHLPLGFHGNFLTA